jgi:NAD(P)-dependent dehydrogenase (short-subunit alcohol dehydrogenase family)
MATVLIVGASRGIGFEFARQYAGDGARVIGTYRAAAAGERLRALGAKPVALDVRDEAAVAAFGDHIANEKLDVAIISAGLYGPRTNDIAAPGGLDFDAVMQTNVRAPMQLMPMLAAALVPGGRLAVISSRMGSISLMGGTAGWLYRASKAAVNAALKSASHELGPQHGVVCIAFHPGWVRTDMGGAGADLDAATSVAGMRRVLASANDSHNGKFLNYNGEQLAW